HRLYQADWMMRFYGFGASELTARPGGNLELAIDPKLAWALANRDEFPCDLQRADRAALLRVPGIGVRNVKRILSMRRWHRVRVADLRRLGIPLRRTLPFVVTADHSPGRLADAIDLRQRIAARDQLDLFAAAQSARTGEL
ncbi:MAG: biotin synthase, partial [Gemmatimonadota bacterium]